MRAVLRNLVALRRSPGFCAAVISCWVLGLSTATITLALADAFFFRPPAHVRDPAEVATVYATVHPQSGRTSTVTKFAHSLYDAFNTSGAAQFAAFGVAEQNAVLLARSVTLRVAFVSSSYFDVLGVRPARGRLLGQGIESQPASPMVISERFWRRSGGSSDVIGQGVRLRNKHFSVIGLAPAGFTAGLAETVDAWVLLEDGAELVRGTGWKSPNSWWLGIVARLQPEVSRSELETRVSQILMRELDGQGGRLAGIPIVTAVPLVPGAAPELSLAGKAVTLVAFAGAALLLISAVNVGGLFALRAIHREQATGVRRALGASTKSLLLDAVIEVLALGVLAALTTTIVILLLQRLTTAVGRVDFLYAIVGHRTFLITVVSAVAASLVVAFVSVASILSIPVLTSIGSVRSTDSRRQRAIRACIVGCQAAGATALIAGAVLLAFNLAALRSLDLGLRISDVVLVSIGRAYALANPSESERLLTGLRARLDRSTVVASTSIAITAPFLSSAGVAVNAPGHLEVWQTKAGVPYLNAVSSNFFATVGMRLLRGRFFDSADTTHSKHVAVVNQTFANVAFPDHTALGKCIVLGADANNPCYEIIGVVADARRFTLVPEEPAMQVYVTLAQNIFSESYPPATLLVKAEKDVYQALERTVAAVRAEVPVEADVSVALLEDIVDPQIRPWRTAGGLWSVFGFAALILTWIGTYITVGYAAARRKREVAIRVALGASRGSVVGSVSKETALSSGLGVIVGVLAIMLLKERILGVVSLTHGVTLFFAVLAAALIVALASTIAMIRPVLRSTQEPLVRALQSE